MTPAEFEKSIISRYYNHQIWFSHFYNKDPNKIDYQKFPYEPVENGSARVHEECFCLSKNQLLIQNDKKPAYVVMMPFLANEMNGKHTKLKENIKLIQDQSFGETINQSFMESSKRIAVVIGCNRVVSLDDRINESFKNFYMRKIPEIKGISVNIFGFLWEPLWSKKSIDPLNFLTTKEKAYKLIKILNQRTARNLLMEIEQFKGVFSNIRTQIPYQDIRERIKNHHFTEEIVKQIRRKSPLKPIFLSLLDSDIKKLRTENFGLFSQYDILIRKFQKENNVLPHVLTTGYCADNTQSDTVKIVIKYDMLKRKIIASILPNGPYYPEPNMIFLLEFDVSLKDYSFKGDGNRLESQRLIQNGIKKGLIDPKKMIFSDSGGIAIELSRLLTKIILECSLSPTKKFLKALHGISQTHAFPRQWAMNLYNALEKSQKKRITDITSPLMNIYTTFDFVSLAKKFPKFLGERYSIKYYKIWKENYDKYIDFLTRERDAKDKFLQYKLEIDLINITTLFCINTRNITKNFSLSYDKIKDFFNEKRENLEKAKGEMINNGVSQDHVDLVCKIARNSGIESHKFLSDILV